MAAYYRRPGAGTLADLWPNFAMPRHHHPTPPTTLEACLRRMRKEFPTIRPLAEEEDLNWWNDGLDALQAKDLKRAEAIFKKLALAQPEHFDGYDGLAQVYQRRHQWAQAIRFAEAAVRLGEAMPSDGPASLDPIALLELKAFRAQLSSTPSAAS